MSPCEGLTRDLILKDQSYVGTPGYNILKFIQTKSFLFYF